MSLSHRRLRRGLIAIACAASLPLAACSNSEESADRSGESKQSQSSDSYTVKHALGETTIEGTPERVAAVGWANGEVPLALGVVPVGMSKINFGDEDGDGLQPWVKEKLDELGADTPTLFDETDGIDYEAVAETEPDVILAAYSGIKQEDYDELSKIAPVIAYPEYAWGGTADEIIELDAEGMNRKEDGKKLVADLHKKVDEAVDKHPELRGKKVLFTSYGNEDPSQIGFYTLNDSRMLYLTDWLGMAAPDVVKEREGKTSEFYEAVSAEHPEQFEDVDVIVSYGSSDDNENAKTLKEMQSNPLLAKIPAIANGNVVFFGDDALGASANPSALSVGWHIDEFVGRIADAINA